MERLLGQCEVTRGRASGPGGQHRNKVETAVSIRHVPTGLVGQASERRSQGQNRGEAIRRLRLRLAVEHRTAAPGPMAAAVTPSALWRSRCDAASGRIACHARHEDFPAMVAEALDALAARHWDPDRAAQALGCTMSQLLKLLGKHPPALAALNAARQVCGLKALR